MSPSPSRARCARAALGILLAYLGVALVGAAGAGASLKVVSTFGAGGSAAGQLQSPQDVSTDAAGNIYVVEGVNRRVSKFSPSGTFLRAWGKDVIPGGATGFEVCTTSCQQGAVGGGGGELNFPTGIATDAAGNVFVADNGNQRVQEFTSDGGFVKTWGKDVLTTGGTGFEICTAAASCKAGVAGGAAGEQSSPFATAVNGNAVYVADSGNNRVQRFDAATGDFERAWGRDVSTIGGTGFEVCVAAAFCKAGISGGGAGEFNQLRGVAAGSDGVYVSDPVNNRIQQFTATGGFTRAWGKDVAPGGGAGFEVCTASCQPGAAGGGPGELSFPQRLAEDTGSVYVFDGNNERVDQFTSSGAFVLAWGKGVLPGGTGGFEVCATSCKAGEVGTGPGEFSSATGVGADANGVYVADQGNQRMQQFAEVPDPSNDFTIGKVKGKKLRVSVPGPGAIDIGDAGDAKKKKLLKPSSATADGEGTVKVPLKLTKGAKKKLRRHRKLRVTARVSFTPTGGSVNTRTAKLKLRKG